MEQIVGDGCKRCGGWIFKDGYLKQLVIRIEFNILNG